VDPPAPRLSSEREFRTQGGFALNLETHQEGSPFATYQASLPLLTQQHHKILFLQNNRKITEQKSQKKKRHHFPPSSITKENQCLTFGHKNAKSMATFGASLLIVRWAE